MKGFQKWISHALPLCEKHDDDGERPEMNGRNGKSETFFMLESGRAVKVTADMYSGEKGLGYRLKARIVPPRGEDPDRAAAVAAEAVSHIFPDNCPVDAPKIAALQLFADNGNVNIRGESCGLAFSIAMAKQILGKNPGPVAATGIIENSFRGGVLGPVAGISEKLNGACGILDGTGTVLYPAGNDADVSDALKKKLKDSGLHVHAVSTVEEALSILFGLARAGRAKKNKNRFPIMAALALFITVLAFFAWQTFIQETPTAFRMPVQEAAPHVDQPENQKNYSINKTGPLKIYETAAPEEGGLPVIDISSQSLSGKRVAALAADKLIHDGRLSALLKKKPVHISADFKIIDMKEMTKDGKRFRSEISAELSRVQCPGFVGGNGGEKQNIFVEKDAALDALFPDLADALAERIINMIIFPDLIEKSMPPGSESNADDRYGMGRGFD